MQSISALSAWREPVTPEELALAKSRLQARTQLESQDPYARMCRIGTQELYFGNYVSAERAITEIEAVDLGAIRRLVSVEWRTALRRPRLAVMGPEFDSGSEARLSRAIRTGVENELRMFDLEARIA
jgi:predicted Zn-dependent peptidase